MIVSSDQDQECENPCESIIRYALEQRNTNFICYQEHYKLRSDFEQSLCHHGECVNARTACEFSHKVEKLTLTGREDCIELSGCNDFTPPSFSVRTGEDCQDGRGVCNADGDCIPNDYEIEQRCDLSNNSLASRAFTLCEAEYFNHPHYCVYYVDNSSRNDDMLPSCADNCGVLGMSCMGSWQSASECGRMNAIGCNSIQEQLTCMCGYE